MRPVLELQVRGDVVLPASRTPYVPSGLEAGATHFAMGLLHACWAAPLTGLCAWAFQERFGPVGLQQAFEQSWYCRCWLPAGPLAAYPWSPFPQQCG